MPPQRIMALDLGKIRIGVAMTDGLGLTAQPLLTIWCKTRNEDLRSLLRLIRKHEVSRVIIGNPLHLSGDLSSWARKVQRFAEELKTRTIIPIELFDERLSTRAAHELLNQAGHHQKGRESIIDQVAATIILENWMAVQQRTQPHTTTHKYITPPLTE